MTITSTPARPVQLAFDFGDGLRSLAVLRPACNEVSPTVALDAIEAPAVRAPRLPRQDVSRQEAQALLQIAAFRNR